MTDRRYPRPRSPPLYNPGRSSLPVLNSLNYGAPGELHAVPTRREILTTPRNSNDRVNAGPVVTTYKIKPEVPSRGSSVRAGSRSRRSTLDGAARPVIVSAQDPRYPPPQSGGVRSESPLLNPYRSSDEGDYYAIPSSSGRHRGHSRQAYSATMDNADMHKLAREYGPSRQLGAGGGRERAAYPRSRRYPDAVADDYGDDGFGYTNPRDLVEYDLNRAARYPNPRRDSYEGSRSARPSSITGYADIMPRSYDNKERGPPPSTRGFDKLPPRGYEQPPPRAPPAPEPIPRSSRADPYDEPPRSSRRPVSVYHEPERHRRDDYYDQRDDDLRERREKPRRTEHYDDIPDPKGYGGRSERSERNDHERRRDYDRHDQERRDDHDDRNEDRHDRKRDLLATGLSLAGAALGINTAKNVLNDDRDDRDEPRRRKDGEEESRRRRDHRDDRDSVDLTGRDPKERQAPREDRGSGEKGRNSPREDRGEFSDRNDRRQDRPSARDDRGSRDEVAEPRERRRHHSDSKTSPSESRDDSSASDEAGGRRHRAARDAPAAAFNPRDTTDLRALKEALNKQNAPAPASKDTALDEKDVKAGRGENDTNNRDDRPRREADRDRSRSEHSQERRTQPRVVSPPREAAKNPEEKPVKGILRPPREKFPEDPMAIREGVAPLKDAKKEGIPPDARWTKISRKLVNPEALEAGKERFEARDDFVIVLRVLTKEEVQGYAAITQTIRARRQEEEDREDDGERRRRRKERHERHRRERHRYEDEHGDEQEREHRRHRRERERDSHSESDTTEDDDKNNNQSQAPKMIDAPKSRKITFDDGGPLKSQVLPGIGPDSSLREDPSAKGVYSGYTRNPPVATTVGAGRKDRD